MLLAVAILMALVAAASPFFRDFVLVNDLETTVLSARSMLWRARVLAEAGSNTSPWGVMYDAATHQMILFSGATFLARDTQFDEPFAVPKTVSVSGASEIVFAKQTGIPVVSGNVTFSVSATNETQTLSINTQGMLSLAP